MRRLPSFLLAAVLAALLAAVPTAGAAERKVPFGFLGTMVDGVFTERPATPLGAETRVMVRTGVERVRLALYWSEAQPDPTVAPDFSAPERVIGAAARRGLPVLVTIVVAPDWARKNRGREWSPPADPVAYGRFAGQVAARFGSRGTFWAEHPELPRVPVRDFQIWNEPAGFEPGMGSVFWDDAAEPYQGRYVAMLRASREAILAADPEASIVLAALFGKSWETLPELLEAGAGGLFDQFALNVFTARPRDVADVARRTRGALADAGAALVPVIYTELTWTAARGRLRDGLENRGYDRTPREQARRLAEGLRRLADKRKVLGIAGVFWYTWLSRHASREYRFDHSGMRRLTQRGSIVSTPAQAAYRRVARRLEGCSKRAIRDC